MTNVTPQPLPCLSAFVSIFNHTPINNYLLSPCYVLGPELGPFPPPLSCPFLSPLCPSCHTTQESGRQMQCLPIPRRPRDPHLLPDLGVDSCRGAAHVWPQGTSLQDSVQPQRVQLLPEAHILHQGCVLDPGLLGHVSHRTLKHNSL